MHNKGAICKIDGLGRIVIPKKYREVLSLKAGSMIEFILLDNAILIQPCHIGICQCCNDKIDLSKHYCANCGKKISKKDAIEQP